MTKLSSHKIKFDNIWLLSFLIYIISGYFANDIIISTFWNSVSLYAFLFISAIMILSNGKLKKASILSWELLFIGLSLFSTLYAPEISLFGETFYALIVNFILIFILTQIKIDVKKLDAIFATFAFSGAGLIVALFLTDNLEDETGRLGTELMGNANVLAVMLMTSAIYGLWMLIKSKRTLHRFIFLFAVILSYVGMLLSGGRKYIIAPLIFLFIALMFKVDEKGRRHIIKYAFIIIVIISALYLLIMKVPTFYQTIGYRFEGVFALFDDSYDVDGSTEIRLKMIDGAFKKWLKSPIWGYGFDSFKYYNRDFLTGHFYYSHNNYTELLYNQGIIGFISYYSFYFYLVRCAVKKCHIIENKGFVIGVIVTLLFFEYFGIAYSITPAQFLLFFCYTILNQGAENN